MLNYYDLAESIESKFNVPNRPGAINLDIQIIIPILCYGQKDEGILCGENVNYMISDIASIVILG